MEMDALIYKCKAFTVKFGLDSYEIVKKSWYGTLFH